MDTLKKVAVIGCGKAKEGQEGWAIGHAHGGALTALSDQVELYGVDLSAENLAAFGERFELPGEQLFASTDALYEAFVPDAVAICTWPKLHAPMAMEAMEKGVKGIVLEKPIALNAGEIRMLVNKAKETGTAISIAHQRIHSAFFQTCKRIADSGVLGEPLSVYAHVGDHWDILSWTTHWFDLANYMLGSAPDTVLAGMDVTDKRLYQHAVENASIIFAEYPDQKSATFLTGPLTGASFQIRGPGGMLLQEGNDVLVLTAEGVERHPIPEAENDFVMTYRELFAEMEGGREALLSINRCRYATEMAYAAHESVRTSRKVSLPLEVDFAPLEVMQHSPVSKLKGIRALLYADAHFGSGGREGIADALTTLSGTAPTVIDAEELGITAKDVQDIDVIVIYHTQSEVDDVTRKVLTDWVNSGKALSIVHAGLGAWPEWSEYHTWCGLIWEWGVSTHPYSPAVIQTTETADVTFPFAEAWLPKDEVFIKLKQTSELILDATATIESGEIYPAAWHPAALPNVGCWMPGHLRSSWKVPSMVEGFGSVLERILR